MIDPAGCADKSLGGPYSIISVGDSKGNICSYLFGLSKLYILYSFISIFFYIYIF